MKKCTGILCPMQCGTVDPATCQAVDYCPQATPPKTNADRIRAMSDEELRELLVTAQYGEYPPWHRARCIRDWLKQEAE